MNPEYRPFPTDDSKRRARLIEWLILAAPLLALLTGCGEASASRPADPEVARAALRDALDSWQHGDPHGATSARTSPIRVADEDWLAGTKLVSYKVDDRGENALGASLRCPVVLKLRDARGKTVTKAVVYEVGTDPVPSVIRQERP